MVYDYIFSPISLKIFKNKINELIEKKIFNNITSVLLMKQIFSKLNYIGYNPFHKGTLYLAEFIFLVYNNISYCENLRQKVYPILAQKHNKNLNNIKCSITSATNIMYCQCPQNLLKDFFNFCYDCKPTTKQVICTILNNLL